MDELRAKLGVSEDEVRYSKVEKMHGVIAELTVQVREKEERISHLLRDLQDEKESSRKQAEKLESSEQRM